MEVPASRAQSYSEGDATMNEPETFRLDDDGVVPNSKLPLLLYRGVLDANAGDPAAAFEDLFARHRWAGSWRNGIYDFHHYHSTAHEVLGIARGHASLRFGGARGRTVDVVAGDAVVIPAGVGHKNEGASVDLLVIGAYPDGMSYDLCLGRPGERPDVLRTSPPCRCPPPTPWRERPGHC